MIWYCSCLAFKKNYFLIICISETWFKPSSDIKAFQVPGYSLLHVCCCGENGGGVALYIREGLVFKLCHDLSGIEPGYEAIFVELDGQKKNCWMCV